jgi:hypothetical protein
LRRSLTSPIRGQPLVPSPVRGGTCIRPNPSLPLAWSARQEWASRGLPLPATASPVRILNLQVRVSRDENVPWLHITMHDPFVVRRQSDRDLLCQLGRRRSDSAPAPKRASRAPLQKLHQRELKRLLECVDRSERRQWNEIQSKEKTQSCFCNRSLSISTALLLTYF